MGLAGSFWREKEWPLHPPTRVTLASDGQYRTENDFQCPIITGS